jgi:hypothetical protein
MESSTTLEAEEEEQKRQFVAVRILRLINTAEAWHFGSFNQYTDLENLQKSDALTRLLESEKAEEKGIGRSLYSTLCFDSDEIIAGWTLKLKVGDNGGSYALSLTDISGKSKVTFTSDNKGIIRGGKEPVESISTWQQTSRRAVSFFKTIALGPLAAPQIGCCCFGGSCCCYCPHCISHCFFNCYNCGCGSCVWCG